MAESIWGYSQSSPADSPDPRRDSPICLPTHYTIFFASQIRGVTRVEMEPGYSPARCSYLSFDLWLPTKRLMIALNSTTQGIALFPESISGNSATRCYILNNYSIITERRYIKICNHMYFLTRNILAQILFLSDVRFWRYLTIDKITLLTTRIPHFVNCQISSEP